MRPPRSPDLVADITLDPTLERGRRSGWRPNNDFGLLHDCDAHIEFADGSVQPGGTGRAELWLLTPELQAGRLREGFTFTLREGSRLVADGVVVQVLRSDLHVGA
ncbi:hypothetical protein LYSHEL_26820 [Lysobacter helvus]|uniref:Elongation factor Tu n=1 Tax=Lysobacter helvus TaxID=2675059 RepID=A0ABN6G555_9GAMM|nr:hypothetical protein LYSHEL_26820 [Lysobacter helvus]